jgi:MSHA pilin protein MshC
MVVIGIIAVVVMPRLDLINGFDQSGFRDELQSALDYARKAAVAARRYVCVDVSGGTVSFTIDTGEPDLIAGAACTAAVAMPLPTSGQRNTGPNSITAPTGVTVTVSGAGNVTFDALGRSVIRATPTSAATAIAVTISTSGGPALSLTVEGETGLVH